MCNTEYVCACGGCARMGDACMGVWGCVRVHTGTYKCSQTSFSVHVANVPPRFTMTSPASPPAAAPAPSRGPPLTTSSPCFLYSPHPRWRLPRAHLIKPLAPQRVLQKVSRRLNQAHKQVPAQRGTRGAYYGAIKDTPAWSRVPSQRGI